MKTYEPGRDEYFRGLAKARIVVGDLFTYDVAVITIMTEGRFYGTLGRQVLEKGMVKSLPILAFNCAEFVETSAGKGFMFVALWNKNNPYTPRDIYNCTRACLKQATLRGLPQIAFPLLGGNERAKFIGAMEQAVDHAEDEADERDETLPEVVFVTNLELL